MSHASARSTWARSSRSTSAVVGVLPQVFEGAGEPALAGLQRRGVGDRAPAVAAVLGVEGEVDADVVVGGAPGRRHGTPTAPGTISEAQVAEPSRSAWYTPTLAAWHEPRSSHDRITMPIVGSVAEPFGEGQL